MGALSGMYARNQFNPISERFLTPEQVPDQQMGIREVARLHSMSGGQGVFHCSCNTKCETKRCKCKRDGRTCNSRCHKNLSCNNHD